MPTHTGGRLYEVADHDNEAAVLSAKNDADAWIMTLKKEPLKRNYRVGNALTYDYVDEHNNNVRVQMTVTQVVGPAKYTCRHP